MKKRTKSLAAALVAALALFAVTAVHADIGRMPSDVVYINIVTADDYTRSHDDPLVVVSRNGPLVASTPKVWLNGDIGPSTTHSQMHLGGDKALAFTGNPAFHGRTPGGGGLGVLIAAAGDRDWQLFLAYG